MEVQYSRLVRKRIARDNDMTIRHKMLILKPSRLQEQNSDIISFSVLHVLDPNGFYTKKMKINALSLLSPDFQ